MFTGTWVNICSQFECCYNTKRVERRTWWSENHLISKNIKKLADGRYQTMLRLNLWGVWNYTELHYGSERGNIYLFIYSTIRLTTGPQHLPQWFLHTVLSSASSFSFQHHLVSFWSSSSCVPLLPRLRVTSIFQSKFPSKPLWEGSSYADVTNPVSLPSFLLYAGHSSPLWL